MTSPSIKALTCFMALGLSAPAFSQTETTIQTKQYDTGGVYEGEFRDGKQHGQGKYTLRRRRQISQRLNL